MERFLNIHFMISAHLVVVALVVVVAAFVNYHVKNDLRLSLEKNVDRQLVLLSDLATITDRNGADEVVEQIIIDCPRRPKFESLLGELGRLSKSSLLEAQQLFESCGGFYAERKALMVARLNREFEVLKDNVSLLEVLDSSTKDQYNLSDWDTLINDEQKRSDLLTEQLDIQEKIITLLISGKTVSSQEIIDLVNEAGQVNDSLSVLGKQIDEKRDRLTL